MSARNFLLGDWNRVIRDPIDVLRLLFLVAAVIFLVQGELGGAARTFATFGALVLARWVDLPRPFDLALVIAMALQTLGYALDFFGKFAFWDETLHLFVPAVVAPLLYITLVRLDALPDLGGVERGSSATATSGSCWRPLRSAWRSVRSTRCGSTPPTGTWVRPTRSATPTPSPT